ncbi:MAG: monofunctional biosynthetic peptidoglycan transglycosylase [Thermodesulfovibrionales bacterium]|nr:monofunctional biosynthetic peptidoglycan transglycosylase [Thermodesulfovibrionales bacterium]
MPARPRLRKAKKKTMGKKKRFFPKIALLLLAAGIGVYFFAFPDVSRLRKENPGKTSFMEQREEEWKKEGKGYKIKRKWVPLKEISPYLIKAVLIAEDDKFWAHEGFDYEAIVKAIEKDIKAKKFKSGGSTVTQQLAKNLYLSSSKNPLRKLREAVIAWRLERSLTKRRILEIYLNVAEWGDGGIFGIEAAANHYYGKAASVLAPEEAARLAAVLPNPRRYNPLGDSGYVKKRADAILDIMIQRGIVVPEDGE